MAIDLTGLSPSQATNTRGKVNEQQQSQVKESHTAKPTTHHSDTVKLSDAAIALQGAQKKLASNTPDTDEARIERIKADIENGNYNINSQRVAEGMLNFEMLLR